MTLKEYLDLKKVDGSLSEIILSLQNSSKMILDALINENKNLAESINVQGENQMNLDIICDLIMINEFKKITSVGALISEEQENIIKLNETGKFIVAYDPIDGSSLLDVNLSVGSIFAIFEGNNVIGKKIKDIKCAGCIIYGPRISMLISFGEEVIEFTLKGNEFEISKKDIKIKEDTKLFSPGNLKVAEENPKYLECVNKWIKERKTLRYSGGMVPDVGAIFLKGEGIFSYPRDQKYTNGKLRLVYEVGPFSFLAKSCGGESLTDKGEDIMDLEIQEIHQRCPIIVGSKNEVRNVIKILNN